MKTTIELPDEQYRALHALAQQEKASDEELLRRALAEYLARRSLSSGEDAAFGLWRNQPCDALMHQERMRREWEQ